VVGGGGGGTAGFVVGTAADVAGAAGFAAAVVGAGAATLCVLGWRDGGPATRPMISDETQHSPSNDATMMVTSFQVAMPLFGAAAAVIPAGTRRAGRVATAEARAVGAGPAGWSFE
jgi:hypothetical protein